jgi:hypothetical protein
VGILKHNSGLRDSSSVAVAKYSTRAQFSGTEDSGFDIGSVNGQLRLSAWARTAVDSSRQFLGGQGSQPLAADGLSPQ